MCTATATINKLLIYSVRLLATYLSLNEIRTDPTAIIMTVPTVANQPFWRYAAALALPLGIAPTVVGASPAARRVASTRTGRKGMEPRDHHRTQLSFRIPGWSNLQLCLWRKECSLDTPLHLQWQRSLQFLPPLPLRRPTAARLFSCQCRVLHPRFNGYSTCVKTTGVLC
jgi:hypothetical protein